MGIIESLLNSVTFIAPFLFVLTVIVFIHELGHFLVARWVGVDVKVFSIGFGPALFEFTDRLGTQWRFSAIPLGGYVKFLGDENAASVVDHDTVAAMSTQEKSRSFAGKSVGARAAIVAAGPLANFLLAILIFTVVFASFGRNVVTPRVDGLVAGGVAEQIGMQTGDLVLFIDGREIDSFADLQRVVGTSAGQTLQIVVDRDGAQMAFAAVPRQQQVEDRFGNSMTVGIIGISRNTSGSEIVTRRYSVPQAAWLGVTETWFIIDQSLTSLYRIIAGTASTDQLGGPIKIAQVTSQVASLGFLAIVNWVALISVSIGLINLFPIPLLDGGHLVFFAVEAIRGKPLSEKVQEMGFRLGFAVIGMLMVFTVWNDIFG